MLQACALKAGFSSAIGSVGVEAYSCSVRIESRLFRVCEFGEWLIL